MSAGCLKEDGIDAMFVMEKRSFGNESVVLVYWVNRG